MRAGFKLLSTVMIVFSFIYLTAQDFQNEPLTLEGQGQVLTFRMVLGGKTAKLFVVGNEAVKLDFTKDAKLLEVTAFKNDVVKEQLQFVPGQGYYTISKLPEWALPYTIRVKANVNGKEESVQLKMKAKP